MVESRNRGYTGRNYTKVAIGGKTFYREYPGRIVQKDSFSIRFPPFACIPPILEESWILRKDFMRRRIGQRLDLFVPLLSFLPIQLEHGRKRARPRDRALSIPRHSSSPASRKSIYPLCIVVGIGKRSTSITRLTRDKEEARLDEVSMEHEPPLRKIQLDGSKNKFFLPFRAISFRLFSTPPSRSICFLDPRPMIAVYYVSCNREFSLPFSRS